MPLEYIVIRGARQHNLKDVNLTIPRDRLVVITGVSGSGKSSLAFDTIYAEGQRRYVESLSAYARQFLGQMEKPDVDHIEGLSPAVSIDQKSTSRNPRSTVATVTEIYDYLRLLFARIGRPHCPECGRRVEQQSAEQMVEALLTLPEGARLQVLAPVVRGRKGEYRRELEDIRKQGYMRVRIDGEVRSLDEEIALSRYKQHTIEVVLDRLVLRAGVRSRLAESVEMALKLSGGSLSVLWETPGPERAAGELNFSEKFACVECGVSLDEIAPRSFSFNSPYGACPACHGLGTYSEFDPELILDPSRSLEEGAVIPFASTTSSYVAEVLKSVAYAAGEKPSTPVSKWSSDSLQNLLFGMKETVPVTYVNHHGRQRSYRAKFEGVVGMLQRRLNETGSQMIRDDLERYRSTRPCPSCRGARLKPEALSVTLQDRHIAAVTALSVGDAVEWVDGLKLTDREEMIGRRVLKEIRERLGFLKDVGLDYLTLDRSAATLAGGEAQRIRLATQIGSGLMGVLYILDEPSIGLHQRDNHRLIETLVRLRNLGNTILVVEHDEETITAADWVIDIGPGAGEQGGRVVAAGTPAEVAANPESVTGRFLSGEASISIPEARRAPGERALVLRGAREHNLRGVTVRLPLGCFIAVTGVSGSGKSTLIQETLFPRLQHLLLGGRSRWGAHDALEGAELIDKVIDIDQSPIGRTPRSNPATYTGCFDLIRNLFAMTTEAKIRGYQPGRFSFNVKGGRCEACKGDGIIKIEMHFLPDVYVPCEVCKGRRYNRETLEVRYRGRNISEVLEMTVAEALRHFEDIPGITRKLSTIHDVGLDYIRLGQPATTLSGGEAQRVKLASELSRRATGRTLYLLDEPTTGLHFHDIRKLLEVLQRLVDTGNTVVVIEHNLDVIKTVDWVIDLGPEGGAGGGCVIAEGTPELIAAAPESHTGRFLKKVLNRHGYLEEGPIGEEAEATGGAAEQSSTPVLAGR